MFLPFVMKNVSSTNSPPETQTDGPQEEKLSLRGRSLTADYNLQNLTISGPKHSESVIPCVAPSMMPSPRGMKKEETLTTELEASKSYERDPRAHLNIIFCGHVDAGKSTCCGHLLYLTGNIDARSMDKNRNDALQKHRDGWEFEGYSPL